MKILTLKKLLRIKKAYRLGKEYFNYKSRYFLSFHSCYYKNSIFKIKVDFNYKTDLRNTIKMFLH